ncbi:AAA family ATPase [Bacillus sp. P1(2020)]|uniref:AAA family ATPase n=1 Tax=Pallidibacillus pasinlerensis TaxID=2703818 RepID=A0ABX0A614_9BACI|nr:AAA family ATPase [Pallidibacillus pasinlerensis]
MLLQNNWRKSNQVRKKQKRILRLIAPNTPPKHPTEKIKNELSELILRAKYNPTTYVWGPPGTGKTYTLARTAAYFYQKGLKILILAHSNAAVDVLMLEIAQFLKEKKKWKTGQVLRYGFSSNQNVRDQNDLLSEVLVEKSFPNLREQLNEFERKRFLTKRNYSNSQGKNLATIEQQLKKIRSTIRREEERFVEDASVLGVTLSKAATDPLIYEQTYDLVIVDEASMAYTPQIAFAATLAKHMIVCGDFKQLPPIAMANHRLIEKWLKRDIFEVARIVETLSNEKDHPNLFMLTKQRRMHPAISSFTNQIIYQNRVNDHPSVQSKREHITAKAPFPNEAAVQIDLSQMGAYCLMESGTGSRFNLFSACVAMQMILTAKREGLNSIGYITPYNAQTLLVNAMIQDFFPYQRFNC